jgi:hypothetical protein
LVPGEKQKPFSRGMNRLITRPDDPFKELLDKKSILLRELQGADHPE